MNRILAYTVVAILLGTVTMVAPLVLLGPNDQIPSEQYTIKATNGGEENQTTSLEVEGTFDRSDIVVSPDISSKPLEPAPTEMTFSIGNVSDLSPIALMTVPSFVVALVVFVYLRKRVS